MRVLLDTHSFLWWIADDPQLSARARQIMGDANTELFLSAVSGWEIAIKTRLGKLTLDEDPETFVPKQVQINAMAVLPVHMSHALRVVALPDLHRDPFDRLLVAQGQLEQLPILTLDPHIAQYDIATLW